MRILIFIALLCVAVQGRGQIYIDSYRFVAAATGDLLLDSFPSAAVAFSLRQLDKDYTGNCLTVRRVNGDTSLIGFVSNFLDTATLKTFCGTASTDTCYVRRWFDQSGNERNAEQTTNTNQPVILRGGEIFYKDGKPALDFDGTNDRLEITSSLATFNFLHNGTTSFVSTVASTDISGISAFLGNTGGDAGERGFTMYYFTTFRVDVYVHTATVVNILNSSANNAVTTATNLLQCEVDADNATAANRAKLYINGGAAITNNTATGAISTANATSNLFIGKISLNSGTFFNGTAKEILIWSTDQASNRTAIRNNINNFYSIY